MALPVTPDASPIEGSAAAPVTAPVTAPAEHIPVIDFAGAQHVDSRPTVAAQVTAALTDIGGFYAVNTLVPQSAISGVADAFRPFFEDWDESDRAAYTARDTDAGARGYIPRFSADLDRPDADGPDPAGGEPDSADQLRSFIFHPYDPRLGLAPLLDISPVRAVPQPDPQNLWTHVNLVPELPGALNGLRVLAALFTAIRGEVFALLEEGLGWHPGAFAGWLGYCEASTVVVNHYQRVPGHTAGGVCLTPHTDLGALTINALDGRSGIKGLYYQGPRSGQWIPAAEPPPAALPIFAGRLLEIKGIARALPHYVRCSDPADAPNRMSVVGFGQPAVTSMVTTAPGVTERFGDYYAREIGRGRLLTGARTQYAAPAAAPEPKWHGCR